MSSLLKIRSSYQTLYYSLKKKETPGHFDQAFRAEDFGLIGASFQSFYDRTKLKRTNKTRPRTNLDRME